MLNSISQPIIVNPVTPKVKARCGICGADIEVIREMLQDDKFSDNYWLAIYMLENCPGCRSHFCKEMGR